MARVFVSIGSNINRYRHIAAALDVLSLHFGELQLSRVYESEAVGFNGDPFLNMVAGFHSDSAVVELAQLLRQIEYRHGRPQLAVKYGPRTMDIDILTYGELAGEFEGLSLPREEITDNAFVLLPLQQIAGDCVHPVLGKSYRQLWSEFDETSQRLWPVDFRWRGRLISER